MTAGSKGKDGRKRRVRISEGRPDFSALQAVLLAYAEKGSGREKVEESWRNQGDGSCTLPQAFTDVSILRLPRTSRFRVVELLRPRAMGGRVSAMIFRTVGPVWAA